MMNPVYFCSLPLIVREILMKYEECDQSYSIAQEMEKDLNTIGWTCEFDLEGTISDVLPRYIIDNHRRTWMRNYDAQSGASYWTTESLPSDTMVYCTPFFDDVAGIPFDVIRDDVECSTFVPIEKMGMDILDEMIKLFSDYDKPRTKNQEPKEINMSWTKIDDSEVRHTWKCSWGVCEDSVVSPDWYQDNGTPTCECGDDMEYSHTEIKTI